MVVFRFGHRENVLRFNGITYPWEYTTILSHVQVHGHRTIHIGVNALTVMQLLPMDSQIPWKQRQLYSLAQIMYEGSEDIN